MNRVSRQIAGQLARRMAPKRGWRLFAGMLLCALVVLFSLAAKVSWYGSHASQRELASMKAFKGDLPVAGAAEAATVMPAAATLVVALAAMMFVVGGGMMPAPERWVRVQEAFVRRAVARPPPVR